MITVLGASGFIGSHLVAFLQRSGLEYQGVARGQQRPGGDLGHVIYSIGVTADFRQRPYDTVESHVCTLLDLVRHASFESILYLSSTRLYIGSSGVAREDEDITVNPLRFEDIYNISKAMGESIVLSLGAKGRVARLSSVYGRGQTETFLAGVVAEAKTRGAILLRSAPESARDYVSAEDVAEVLVNIALRGRERIYNVASGVTLTNGEVAAAIARHTGCSVTFNPDAAAELFPRIDNERIRSEFAFKPAPLMNELPSLLGSGE